MSPRYLFVHLVEEAESLVGGEGFSGDGVVTKSDLVGEDVFDAPGDPP